LILKQTNKNILFAAAFIFILINAVFIYYGNYFVNLVSILLVFIYFAVFSYEKLFFLAVFLTPLSISLDEFFSKLEFNLSIPSEGIFAALLFIIALKFFKEKNYFKVEVFKHPVSIAIIFYLFWIFITSITSTMPLVSFKFFLVKLWFIIPIYFFSFKLFEKEKNINLFLWLYIISFTIVIFYTINNHLSFGFYNKLAAHIAMSPFYNNHTSYGAFLAMYIPVIAYFLLSFKTNQLNKILSFTFLLIFIVALVLSYTRAAWISLIAAIVFGLIMYLKINIKFVIFIGVATVITLFTFRVEIIDKLDKNKQDSSTNLNEHVKSISNIATDASNLERINRWNSALKMFKEKPVFGWGSGTYMFKYAAFQKADDKTIISTNFGEVGNAHSEYIGPLAERGILGMLSVFAIIFFTLKTALSVYSKSDNKQIKNLVLSLIMGLTTYYIHGLLNNYLDTDKASVPFWGFTAIIVYLDLKIQTNNKAIK